MSIRRRGTHARVLVASVVLLAVWPARIALPAEARTPFNRRLRAFDASAVERARAGAARWLQQPECLKVLAEFGDGDGRTLDRVLETWGMSAVEYLMTLSFWDGTAIPRCHAERVELVTIRGLPHVYVCAGGVGGVGSRFAGTQTETPTLAEAMVIHEMLHTLGLGENPPSSFEITDRTRSRCR